MVDKGTYLTIRWIVDQREQDWLARVVTVKQDTTVVVEYVHCPGMPEERGTRGRFRIMDDLRIFSLDANCVLSYWVEQDEGEDEDEVEHQQDERKYQYVNHRVWKSGKFLWCAHCRVPHSKDCFSQAQKRVTEDDKRLCLRVAGYGHKNF